MINIGFQDVLDIVLVALLLYYIYRLMKESSSANIFGGIIVFIVVWIVVSQIFEMKLLGGILDKVVNVGSLALHAPYRSGTSTAVSAPARTR